MSFGDPTLADRELAGLGGMLCWGPPSSVGVIMAWMMLDTTMLTPGIGVLLVVMALIGLIIAFVVWVIGGLFVALPLWAVLIALGMRGRLLVGTMVGLGAAVVSYIWVWFTHTPMGSSGFCLVVLLGAATGALGAYGFCRSAMRS